MKKRLISVFMTLVIIVGMLCSYACVASAAKISSDKHTATGIYGGQTVYIKSNTGWNTELFGNTFRTKVQISLSKTANNGVYELYQFNLSTRQKVSVEIFKKSGSSWVKYKTGNYNCNINGVICDGKGKAVTFVLPGKGIDYKIKITPKVTYNNEIFDVYKASDIKNIKLKITSYGTIKSVS